MTIKIFLTGATGYIGGSVLTQLLDHKNAKAFDITVLVRSNDKAKLLGTLGLRTVLGSTSDHDILSREASVADVVIACVDADDSEAAKTILAGMKKYHKRTGQRPTLIHTSGTGVISFESHGMFATEHVYSDLDIPSIEGLPSAQPHREIDVMVVQADDDGYVDTYIVLPATIYGRATGILVDKAIQKPFSAQIPSLVKISLERGQAAVIGKGKNMWPDVEIHEVAALYVLILDLALVGSSSPAEFKHGREGYYFVENGEYTMLQMSGALAKLMHGMGVGTEKPTMLSPEEMTHFFPPSGKTSLSTNSRCSADRGKAVGWRPTKTTRDMLASIKEELKAFVGMK